MTTNPNAPHFVLAATQRIYPDLPELVGQETWKQIKSQVDNYIEQMETAPNAYLASTQLFGMLAQYEAARQRLAQEITLQKITSENIAEQVRSIADRLHLDAAAVDGLTAAAFAKLRWEYLSETVPPPEDTTKRGITLTNGGVGGATSVKFKNMSLDLGDFSVLAAGFIASASDVLDKPYPLIMAAAVLLTIRSLYDEMKAELTEQEASVFWGMTRAGKIKLTEADILAATNAEREKYGLEPLKEGQLRYSLTRLEQIKSIEKTDNIYRIIEDYQVRQ